MASLYDCIETAKNARAITSARARATQSEFVQLVERYRTAMPLSQAQAKAAADLKEAFRRRRTSRRAAVLAQLQAQTRIKTMIERAPDPAVAVRNMVEHSDGSGWAGESLHGLARGMERWVNGRLNGFLRSTGTNVIGTSRDKALLKDVIRILHGDQVQNPAARAFADAIRTTQEDLRRMFNAWGGDIGKLQDFGVSHAHDGRKIGKAGYPAWKRQIEGKLDWSRIVDHGTGAPFAARKGDMPDPVAAERFLKDIYRGIVTGGWSRREPSMAMGGKALYNQRAEHRLLHFKSGEDWLAYNADFGAADPFSAVVGGLHGIARDVAQMRSLGPNPRMALDYAIQVAEKRVADMSPAERSALEAAHKTGRAWSWAKGRPTTADEVVRQQGALAKTMLAHFDGSANQTEYTAWAAFFANTRGYLASIQLGSAQISAVTDLATISKAAQIVGMQPRNVLSRSVKLMASQATRETAARMGYVADTLAEAGAAQGRFTGEVVGGELAHRLSGFTMRASGLSYWTDMHRIAFQMEFAGYLADNADRAFGAIAPDLRRVLSERGITPADWDALRAPAGRFTAPGSGADFIAPFHWLEHQTALKRPEAEGLAFRLQQIIEEHLEFAVPTATLEGRARLIGDTAPGTVTGEIARSFGTYKSFAMSLTIGQIRRFNALASSMDKLKYAASLGASLVVLGAVAIQLKELAKGRDPKPMTTSKFWGAAVMQSGGLGIFGDFFASETSRAGGGLAETIAGPVVGLASDVLRPVVSNAARAANGDDILLGRDAANFVRYNTPVASSLWYSRAAFDHAVADTLQGWLDPDAEAQWRRAERRRARDYGNGSYWQSGDVLPTRPPNLSNATEVMP